MSKEQAIAELNAQWAAGDITQEQYEAERQRIEYAHGEQMSAQDERAMA